MTKFEKMLITLSGLVKVTIWADQKLDFRIHMKIQVDQISPGILDCIKIYNLNLIKSSGSDYEFQIDLQEFNNG